MILQDTNIYGIGLGLGSHIGTRIFRFGNHRLRVVVEVVEVVVLVEVVEVVDVVEVVVLGSSWLRTLAFRSSGSTGSTVSGYSGTGLLGHARRRPAQNTNEELVAFPVSG